MGNRLAEEAWRDFHGFIEEAKATVGTGILFDMHGQVRMKRKRV